VLLTLRVPLVDLRQFYRSDYPKGIRLPAAWSEDRDFVRYFGPVTRRFWGPVNPWAAERVYCQCDRVLRFPASYPALLSRSLPALSFFGIKRRLFPATTRNDLFHADVHLLARRSSGARQGRALIELAGAVPTVLGAPTAVHYADGLTSQQPLGAFGKAVARALDMATTLDSPSGLIYPGTPAVALEAYETERVKPGWGVKFSVDGGPQIIARTVVFAGKTVNTFLITHAAGDDYNVVRALRVHILRLHSEREFLRRIVQVIAREDFPEEFSEPQVERLQFALNQSLAALTRAQSHGFSTPELMTAFLADSTLSGADLDVLTDRVSGFRPVISRRLKALRALEGESREEWQQVLADHPEAKNFFYIREAHMSTYDQRNSQIGAAGDNPTASNFSFAGQLNLTTMPPGDIDTLISAVRTLRKHLAGHLADDRVIDIGTDQITAAQIGGAIGDLSEAEAAITGKDQARLSKALARSGQWLASFAHDVGVDIVAAAIRASLHLP